jgi:hypothetical protein
VDSRLRRSPPDRASAVPYGQAGENAMRFPHLAHRSAAAHKLHSTPQQDKMNLISGKVKPAAGYRPLAYSSPEAVQTTGTVAPCSPPSMSLKARTSGAACSGHRHQEFIRFLNKVEREVPPNKAVHVILNNYATHNHPKVTAWLQRHLTTCSSAGRRSTTPLSVRSFAGPSAASCPWAAVRRSCVRDGVDPQAWLGDVLAGIAEQPGGLIMAAIAAVFTIGYVVNLLGETKTGCTSCRSTCFPKTAASGSMVWVSMT